MLHFRNDIDKLELIQERTARMVQGLDVVPFEDWLKELRKLNLEKRSLMLILMAVFEHLKGCHIDEELDLLHLIPEGRTCSSVWSFQRPRTKEINQT